MIKNWPTTSMDWRGIVPGDKVEEVLASESPTAQAGYVVTKPDGTRCLATWDSKSSLMAQRHLLHWSRAGECTKTLAEARLKVARRGRA